MSNGKKFVTVASTNCLSACLYIAFSIDGTCMLRWLQLFSHLFSLNRVLSHHWSHSFRNQYSSLATCLKCVWFCGYAKRKEETERANEIKLSNKLLMQYVCRLS